MWESRTWPSLPAPSAGACELRTSVCPGAQSPRPLSDRVGQSVCGGSRGLSAGQRKVLVSTCCGARAGCAGQPLVELEPGAVASGAPSVVRDLVCTRLFT